MTFKGEEMEMNKKQSVILFVIIGIVVLTLFGCEKKEKLSRVREIISTKLYDASSARFDKVTYLQTDREELWSGWINAKNLYGAYTGFETFNLSVDKYTKQANFMTHESSSKNEDTRKEYDRIEAIFLKTLLDEHQRDRIKHIEE